MRKVLLTSVCRPLGPDIGDSESVGYELLHGQITRAQGIFSPRCFTHHFSLEYIAHNLEHPTVVLQYPSEKEFTEEVKKGYDFVGISFILATSHHMKRMSAIVRKYSPQSKIILGGYGTVMSDEELAPWGDYYCRGEGTAFMRKLLGEDDSRPVEHPLIINGLKVFSMPVGNNGMIFGGLGCPNGCDFCATSHFFKRKHIRLLETGDDVFNLIQRYRQKDPKIKFSVLDEDFLLNQKRAYRFLELVRRSKEAPPSMFIFASVKALSMYQVSDLLEMGITGVWVGYEGRRSGYAKQQGRDIKEIFHDLRTNGVTILASMVIGFDYQTKEVIRQEREELLSLKPTFTQFLIYGPTPGTPFYDRVVQEKRLVPELAHDREAYYKKCTGFYDMVKHPVLSSAELEDLQRECYEADFNELGPSVIRSIENWFLGYQNLIVSDNELLRKKGEMYRDDILNSMPIFMAARKMGPSHAARSYAENLEKEIIALLKPNPFVHGLKSWAAFGMANWTAFCQKMKWFQHPKLTRLSFREKASGTPGAREKAAPPAAGCSCEQSEEAKAPDQVCAS